MLLLLPEIVGQQPAVPEIKLKISRLTVIF
jgi:hypothetical protein